MEPSDHLFELALTLLLGGFVQEGRFSTCLKTRDLFGFGLGPWWFLHHRACVSDLHTSMYAVLPF